MDISELMNKMLSSDAVKGIGRKAGCSQKSVRSVLSSALPAMLSGAKAQADGDTAESFVNALSDHAKDDTADVKSFLSGVDLKDGGKIIGHLLGGNAGSEIRSAAETAGIRENKAGNILSAAAPLLMSLLGKQVSSGSDAQSNNAAGIGGLMGNLLSNVDLGSVIGGLTGSGSGGGGNILSSLFGLFGKK